MTANEFCRLMVLACPEPVLKQANGFELEFFELQAEEAVC